MIGNEFLVCHVIKCVNLGAIFFFMFAILRFQYLLLMAKDSPKHVFMSSKTKLIQKAHVSSSPAFCCKKDLNGLKLL